MSKLITNVNAPIIDVHIQVNFQTQPETIMMKCSRTMPATVMTKIFTRCIDTCQDLLMPMEAQAAGVPIKEVKPPDLPPPPAVS